MSSESPVPTSCICSMYKSCPLKPQRDIVTGWQAKEMFVHSHFHSLSQHWTITLLNMFLRNWLDRERAQLDNLQSRICGMHLPPFYRFWRWYDRKQHSSETQSQLYSIHSEKKDRTMSQNNLQITQRRTRPIQMVQGVWSKHSSNTRTALDHLKNTCTMALGRACTVYSMCMKETVDERVVTSTHASRHWWREMEPLKHAYRYLHFEVIPVQPDANICYCSLEKPRGPQHQDQLQVPWKCPLLDQEAYS